MFTLSDLKNDLDNAMVKLRAKDGGTSASEPMELEEPQPSCSWQTPGRNRASQLHRPVLSEEQRRRQQEEEAFFLKLNTTRAGEREHLSEMIDFVYNFREALEDLQGIIRPLSKAGLGGDKVRSQGMGRGDMLGRQQTRSEGSTPGCDKPRTALFSETLKKEQERENIIADIGRQWDTLFRRILDCIRMERHLQTAIQKLLELPANTSADDSAPSPAAHRKRPASPQNEPPRKRLHLEGRSQTSSESTPEDSVLGHTSVALTEALYQGPLSQEEFNALKLGAMRFTTSKKRLSALALSETLCCMQATPQIKLRLILKTKSNIMSCFRASQDIDSRNLAKTKTEDNDQAGKLSTEADPSSRLDTVSPELQLGLQFYISDQDLEGIGSEILRVKCLQTASDTSVDSAQQKSPVSSSKSPFLQAVLLDDSTPSSTGLSLTGNVLKRMVNWHLIAWAKYIVIDFPPFGQGITGPSLYILNQAQMLKLFQSPLPFVTETRILEVMLHQALNRLASLQSSSGEATADFVNETKILREFIEIASQLDNSNYQLLQRMPRSGTQESERDDHAHGNESRKTAISRGDEDFQGQAERAPSSGASSEVIEEKTVDESSQKSDSPGVLTPDEPSQSTTSSDPKSSEASSKSMPISSKLLKSFTSRCITFDCPHSDETSFPLSTQELAALIQTANLFARTDCKDIPSSEP